jgi:ABC-type sugar transport system substrate-binding protein
MAVAGLAAGATACNSTAKSNAVNDTSTTTAAATSATTSGGAAVINGGGKQVVVFMPNNSLGPYITGDNDAIVGTLTGYQYKVDVITNQFSQTQEDQQVQQYLATGQKPAAFLYWPTNAASGVNDARLLSRVAPVIQFNQAVLPAEQPYVKLFVGDLDTSNGTALANMLTQARTAQQQAGATLHSSGGNLLVFDGPTGYEGSIVRWSTFTSNTTATPFDVVGTTYNTTAADGYNGGLSIIPQAKAKGIDFVYAYDGDIATGAVKALTQEGLVPGKDVLVVDGNCTSSLQPYLTGQIYGTTLQSGVIEGIATAQETARYLAVGSVTPGTENLPDTPQLPTDWPNPSAVNAIPVPAIVGASQMNSAMLWGYTAAQLCANQYKG